LTKMTPQEAERMARETLHPGWSMDPWIYGNYRRDRMPTGHKPEDQWGTLAPLVPEGQQQFFLPGMIMTMFLRGIDEYGDNHGGPEAAQLEVAKGGTLRFHPLFAAKQYFD